MERLFTLKSAMPGFVCWRGLRVKVRMWGPLNFMARLERVRQVAKQCGINGKAWPARVSLPDPRARI
jgi:hypothetical protein